MFFWGKKIVVFFLFAEFLCNVLWRFAAHVFANWCSKHKDIKSHVHGCELLFFKAKETSMSDSLNTTSLPRNRPVSSCYFGSRENSNVCSLTLSFLNKFDMKHSGFEKKLCVYIDCHWLLHWRELLVCSHLNGWMVWADEHVMVMMMIWRTEAKCQVKI